MPNPVTLPPAAINWLTVWSQVQVLALEASPQLASRLAAADHQVLVLARTETAARRLAELERVTTVAARGESLPFEPRQFDVAIAHQTFHRLIPDEALPQIARVLRPGGCLSASYLIRDDSVPWVRRLAALLRHYDPKAMRGDYGQASLEMLTNNKHFPEVERRAFRIWQSISRADLQQLIASQPLAARLDKGQRLRLEDQVGELFDASAKPGEQLRLPFQLLCWRAWVDHSSLSSPTSPSSSGFKIQM